MLNFDTIRDCFIKKRFEGERTCPHCHATYTVRYGKYNGKQRYKCKTCSKTFSDFTNTPFIGTHYPDKWPAFILCTLKGISLKNSAKQLHVSYVTLFYWRHKLLAALDRIEPEKFIGIVELCHMFLNYSRKGEKHLPEGFNKDRVHGKSLSAYNISSKKVCVLTALDSHSSVFSRAVCRGSLTYTHIEKALGNLFTGNNTVCSDTSHIFLNFLNHCNIKKSPADSGFSGSALKYITECILWIKRFRGVATKYLNHYMSCFNFLETRSFNDVRGAITMLLETISSISNRVGAE